MKTYFKTPLILFALSPIFASSAHASLPIEIERDADRCADGWLSMDVAVKIGEEKFEFSPSCQFSFTDHFTTKTGETCHVEAGMCSGFMPENAFEVNCNDGSSQSIEISCPNE